MPKKIAKQWTKPLSNAAKAEMLAATFHLFTAHMPKEFAKLPKWLQSQMRQTMFDCSVDHRDFTKKDIKDLIEYGQWLDAKFPQTKPRKKRSTRREKPPVNDMAMRDFLYNKESSGR